MNEEKAVWWWILGAFAVAGIAAALYFWQPTPAPEPLPQIPPRVEPAPAPQAKAEPQIQHPIEQTEGQPLPPLAESDAAMKEALADLFGQKVLREFFHLDGIIRRIVATVDNLPREKVAQRIMPLKRVEGRFLVTGAEGSRAISPDNHVRYAPYVRLAEAADTKMLVALYVRFYPLFQQTYRELGYPSGYFNDRLVEVIDHLLAAPDVSGPVKLVQPRVFFYQFADPELEARSAGQKILIRIGAENAGRVKAKLRELRRELTGQVPKP